MTLKELLLKVEFDNVAPFILQHYPELSKCMAGFKMAFDDMRNTVAADADGETINVELCTEEGEEPYLSAYHVDNDVWENVVRREVVIDSNVTASFEEIVAVILFEATFFGFTPTDRNETFEEWEIDRKPPTNGNLYRIKWWNLTQKQHDSQCSKEDIGKRTYTLDPEHPLRELRDKPMNRSKRKRAYRWVKRIDRLESLANRWDLLQKMKRSVIDADLTVFENLLFKVDDCEVYRYEDFSKDATGLSYIYELLNKYNSKNISRNADITILWIQTPKDVDRASLSEIASLFSNTKILHDCSSKYERTKLTIVQLLDKR